MSVENQSAGIVIIGAGLAGWHVIDAIRAKDKNIPITLITADNGDRYHKPMLTMAISQQKNAEDLVRATGSDAAEAANINLLANTQVTDIDPTSQTVQLISALRSDPVYTNYATISYDKLVLAMGAHPIFPKSLPEDLVWHVNHIERFGQLQEKLAAGSQRVAIVGAGMVGTEIAEDLLKAGHEVTLIDLNDAPLSQMLPPQATARIAKAVQSQGIHFLGGYQVSNVTRHDDGTLQVSYAPVAATDSDAAQAATIADDILGHEHSGYDHKPPMIRLKNKAISVMVTGVPQVAGNWQVTTETDDELVMDLLDDNDAVSATVTIKAPPMVKS